MCDMNTACLMCEMPVEKGEERAEGRWMDEKGASRIVHRECALRAVIGGIGHLTNHEIWCNKVGDPDGGVGYRASAIMVDQWIREHGMDAALDKTP
jgi:hypothetical protein